MARARQMDFVTSESRAAAGKFLPTYFCELTKKLFLFFPKNFLWSSADRTIDVSKPPVYMQFSTGKYPAKR